MVVSMRAVAVQRDDDEQKWNATTLELRRKEGRTSCRDAN
jgi:hypothetical protein